ncbi:MAG: GyrI-like domain-containing protein [Ekhidna sp.]
MEAIMEKLDLSKTDKNYYSAKSAPEIRDIDAYYFLTVSGKGSPESALFLGAIQQLYAVAYAIKFICKSEDDDFVVPKMEGYWWIDGGLEAQHKFAETPRDQWNWKIAVRMPDFVEGDHYFRAIQKVKAKNENFDENRVKYELIEASKSVQILHKGSYEEEMPNIMKMMDFVKENGLEVSGYHHEIYLSDPRRTPEERLKTILRYAVK